VVFDQPAVATAAEQVIEAARLAVEEQPKRT
jgi:hypothetical protein